MLYIVVSYFTRIEVRTAPATAPAITAPVLLW